MEQDGVWNKTENRNMIEDGTRWRIDQDGEWNKIEDAPKWRIGQDRGWEQDGG